MTEPRFLAAMETETIGYVPQILTAMDDKAD